MKRKNIIIQKTMKMCGSLLIATACLLNAQSTNAQCNVTVTPGNPVICAGDNVTLNASAATFGYGTNGSALQFDGINDYVNIPALDLSTGNQITLEAWVRPANITSSTYYNVIRQEGGGLPDWLMAFQNRGTILSFGLKTNGGYYELDVPITATDYTDGNWHHIAATYDGSSMKLYVDGNQIGSRSKTGTISKSGHVHSIGRMWGKEYFNGAIDEVRFWNIAKTQSEIQNEMNCAVIGSETGLVAAWNLNEGSGLTTIDVVNGYTGNIQNGTAWTTSSVAPNCVAMAVYNFSWSPANGLNSSTGASVTASPTTTTQYTVTAIGDNGCTATTTVTVTVNPSPIVTVTPANSTICAGDNVTLTASADNGGGNTPGNALYFDGVNDRVDIPTFDLSGGNQFTMEVWVKPTNITTYTYYNINRQQGVRVLPDWLLAFQNGGRVLSFGLKTNGYYVELDVAITASDYTDGNWHHIAATYDGSLMRLYSDGVLIGSRSKSGNISMTGSVHNIGSMWSREFFKGYIDEFRIWNISKTLTQIQDDMNCAVTGTETGLVAAWNMDEGSGLTTTDVVNSYSGTLRNGVSWASSAVAPVCAPLNSFSWSPATGLSSTTGETVIASPTTTTTYTVTVTDANGCSGSATADITVNPLPVANAGDDQTVLINSGGGPDPLPCVDLSATATDGTGPYNFSWSPVTGLDYSNIANPQSCPANTTTYTVTVTNANGCSATDAATVTVIDIAGNDLAPYYSNNGGQSVYMCDVSTGTTITVNINANCNSSNSLCYQLLLRNTLGPCTGKSGSGIGSINEAGNEKAEGNNYLAMERSKNFHSSIFPNPNRGLFNIVINSDEATTVSVEITDILGSVIYRNENTSTNNNLRVDLSNHSKGVYFLKVIRQNDVMIKKIMIQ